MHPHYTTRPTKERRARDDLLRHLLDDDHNYHYRMVVTMQWWGCGTQQIISERFEVLTRLIFSFIYQNFSQISRNYPNEAKILPIVHSLVTSVWPRKYSDGRRSSIYFQQLPHHRVFSWVPTRNCCHLVTTKRTAGMAAMASTSINCALLSFWIVCHFHDYCVGRCADLKRSEWPK